MVDGKTDPCSREENIVFTFSGFPVFGQVLCLLSHSIKCPFLSSQVTSKGLKTGPAGVTVQLKTRGVTSYNVKNRINYYCLFREGQQSCTRSCDWRRWQVSLQSYLERCVTIYHSFVMTGIQVGQYDLIMSHSHWTLSKVHIHSMYWLNACLLCMCVLGGSACWCSQGNSTGTTKPGVSPGLWC